MKKNILLAALILVLAYLPHHAISQCTGGTNGGALVAPTLVFQTRAVTGGNYYTFAGVSGTNYIFTFCQGGGSAGFDCQLTILDNGGAYAGGYSDDVCGVAPELTWNCPANGTYRVLFNTYFCTTGGAATMAYRQLPPPGPGSNCGNPHIIPSLPFTASGLTTCGFFDDYNSTVPCNSIYMNGEDYVFRYVAAGAGGINVTLTGTLSFTGVFVVQGCPNSGGVCIPVSGTLASCSGGAATNESGAGNPFGTFCLPGAGTYYIIVDTWPSPNCTPFNISVTSTSCTVAPAVTCYNQSTPAWAPDLFTGTLVSFPDDEFSPVIPIPFTFCYMGTDYNSLVISSNSYITFNTACAGQYSEWDTEPVPTTAMAGVQNAVMAPWQDIDPGVSGQVNYAVYGTAPNRRMVINFRNIAYFSFSCNAMQFRGQIILFETTNVIRTNIADKLVCASWNNGEAVHALTDPSGTVAVVVPGRNNTVWTTTNNAVDFTPCAPCITPLPATWASFTGTSEGKINRLNWATNYELNTNVFVVERSRNGDNWEVIDHVDAIGNNPMGNSYQTSDEKPYPLMTYYRLRVLDMNGSENTSEVIRVSRDENGIAIKSLVQQPGSSQIELNVLSGINGNQAHIAIADAAGKTLMSFTETLSDGVNTMTIDVSALATGCYFFTVTSADGYRETRNIIIR